MKAKKKMKNAKKKTLGPTNDREILACASLICEKAAGIVNEAKRARVLGKEFKKGKRLVRYQPDGKLMSKDYHRKVIIGNIGMYASDIENVVREARRIIKKKKLNSDARFNMICREAARRRSSKLQYQQGARRSAADVLIGSS